MFLQNELCQGDNVRRDDDEDEDGLSASGNFEHMLDPMSLASIFSDEEVEGGSGSGGDKATTTTTETGSLSSPLGSVLLQHQQQHGQEDPTKDFPEEEQQVQTHTHTCTTEIPYYQK